MKRIIELSENDYKTLKEDGVQNHLALANSIITHSVPYEERPKGEWIGNNFDEHHCSLCGHYALYQEEPDDYYEVQSNFCPNCGADMRKENKNDLFL